MSAMKDHRLERLIFFSDAVIAIAITLLIIELHAPHLPRGDIAAGLRQLQDMLPSFFGFLVSFLVIGRFWQGHSAALGSMTGMDPRLFRPNLYFLMMIVIMPFSTALLSANLGEVVAATFYNVTLALTALANMVIVRIATDPTSGHSSHDPIERSALLLRSRVVAVAALICIAVGLVAPGISQAPMVALLFADRFLLHRGGTAK